MELNRVQAYNEKLKLCLTINNIQIPVEDDEKTMADQLLISQSLPIASNEGFFSGFWGRKASNTASPAKDGLTPPSLTHAFTSPALSTPPMSPTKSERQVDKTISSFDYRLIGYIYIYIYIYVYMYV